MYDELRRVARSYMRRERPNQTLDTTGLVHEAWLRLSRNRTSTLDRQRFLAIAARVMREILVDRARARIAEKRWSGVERVPLTDAVADTPPGEELIVEVNDALSRLEEIDPEQARIVELRFFDGLSIEDTSAAMNVSPATLKRRWSLVRAWLLLALGRHR